MCHMLADTEEELHTFAFALGLKREWFQPLSTPHYDLSLERRRRALQLGAIEIDRYAVYELIKRWRQKRMAKGVDIGSLDA